MGVAQNQLQIAPHRGQRGAQFVASVTHEALLPLERVLKLGAAFFQFLEQGGALVNVLHDGHPLEHAAFGV